MPGRSEHARRPVDERQHVSQVVENRLDESRQHYQASRLTYRQTACPRPGNVEIWGRVLTAAPVMMAALFYSSLHAGMGKISDGTIPAARNCSGSASREERGLRGHGVDKFTRHIQGDLATGYHPPYDGIVLERFASYVESLARATRSFDDSTAAAPCPHHP